MNTTGWIILGIVNIPVYFFIGKLIFKTWENFGESIRFWFTPDLFSAFNGEYWDDWIGELKLGAWIACCYGCVYAEAHLVGKLLG